MMVERYLEASVQRTPAGAVVDLRGEIDAFAEEAMNAAYADAEASDPDAILLNFEGVDYIRGILFLVGSPLAPTRRRA